MRRRKIAVLMASIDREYQQDFAAGLASAGAKFGMDICIFNSQGYMNVEISTSEKGDSMIYDLPDLEDFDGIISMPATMGNETAAGKLSGLLGKVKGKPHVSIDVRREGAVSILFNDRISMEEMTEHLISEHGVRKIAFVSGPLNSRVARERIEACRNALKRHGLTLDDRLVFDGQWTRTGGRKAAERLLEIGGELPDAVMCGNDDMALSVIECLNDHGIRVPQDIAVTGFDALREAVMRGVTTICRPIDKSARKAVDILKKWAEGEEPKEDKLILSTIPIFGESCGCIQSMEHNNEKIRVLGAERWNMETKLARLSMFSGSMAGVGDETEARDKIRSFVSGWDIREFYLCVDPSVCRETEDSFSGKAYPDRMLLLYGYRNGIEYDISMIPRRELTPSLREVRKNASCLVFSPLYYRDRSLGYVAMDLGNGTGTALYPVVMILNGALVSLYLQTNLKRSAAMIETMATRDIMTGMLNRRGYMEQAPAELEQAREQGRIFVLLSADMDRMKEINDRYGHLAGDEAICRMGRAVQRLKELSLTPVHISGDEFLAYGIADDPEEAENVVRFFSREVERINREEPWICDISASSGVFAAVPGEGEDLDRFMTMADRAMYEDKKRKKN